MALKYIYNIDVGIKTYKLKEVCEYVAKASARELPVNKAIVGKNIFAHESGIHADGVIKYPKTYEVFTPEEVGGERQIVIGKHSGTHALIRKFQEYAIQLSEEDAQELLKKVRALAVELKRPLFDKELMYLYQDYLKEKVGKEGV